MPCLPGLTPVLKVDQATGDMGGQVLPSVANVPVSRRAARCGIRPASIRRVARRGSMPSKPTITTRLNRPLGALRNAATRRRTGSVSSVSRPREIATRSIRNDPMTAKPVPGPI